MKASMKLRLITTTLIGIHGRHALLRRNARQRFHDERGKPVENPTDDPAAEGGQENQGEQGAVHHVDSPVL
jgi:hypothetical protein